MASTSRVSLISSPTEQILSSRTTTRILSSPLLTTRSLLLSTLLIFVVLSRIHWARLPSSSIEIWSLTNGPVPLHRKAWQMNPISFRREKISVPGNWTSTRTQQRAGASGVSNYIFLNVFNVQQGLSQRTRRKNVTSVGVSKPQLGRPFLRRSSRIPMNSLTIGNFRVFLIPLPASLPLPLRTF